MSTPVSLPVNMPKIKFYINSSSGVTITSSSIPSVVSLVTTNPFFISGTNGITQPPNWYYYLIKNNGTSTNYITISIDASAGYTLPAISYMFTGSGGKGGAGSGCGGGGGGTGGVALINNYLSGVNNTFHAVNLYPLGSSNSVMYLDVNVNLNNYFYANTGGAGGNASTSASANGGNGGTSEGFAKVSSNSLPIYNAMLLGGAGGNKGQPNGSGNDNHPGTSYNGFVNPPGSSLGGNDPPAYVPVTFADGLSVNLLYGGKGGLLGPSTTPGVGGTAGQSGAPSMLMLYFCL
jgi:hypothetical protein